MKSIAVTSGATRSSTAGIQLAFVRLHEDGTPSWELSLIKALVLFLERTREEVRSQESVLKSGFAARM